MATYVGPSRTGFSMATPEVIHEEMKRLHNMLLTVGLTEVVTDESYDTSESSDASGVPTEVGSKSKFMYFAFSDELQATAPIYICIRLSRSGYFNLTARERQTVIEVYVSRFMEDGLPVISGALSSFGDGPISYGNGVDSGELKGIMSDGDFAVYSGNSLFVAFGANALRQRGNAGNSTITGPTKSSLFLVLSRVGNNVVAFLDRRNGVSSNTVSQTVRPAILTSPFSNVYSEAPNIAHRAGNILFDTGVPIVAPIYGWDEYGTPHPLQGMYTIPSSTVLSLASGQTIRLDFTGEEKNYLYFESPSVCPGTSDQGWLIEWQ